MEDDKARLNAGFVYAAVLNSAWGDPSRRAAQPTDIVPSMMKHGDVDLTQMTPEEQQSYLMREFFGKRKTTKR